VTYRVGRHLGRTIYRDDELIGIMDTPELGSLVVEALNARDRVLQAGHQVEGRAQVPSGPVTCGRVGMHNCGITGRWESHDSGYPQVGGPAEELPPSEALLLPSEKSSREAVQVGGLVEIPPSEALLFTNGRWGGLHGLVDTSQESIGEHIARCSGCA
jgi:hypothetical protein